MSRDGVYAEVQEILEELYPMGMSVKREVDLPNGMKRVSYVALPADKLEELMQRFENNS